jgi:hypothetical protein
METPVTIDNMSDIEQLRAVAKDRIRELEKKLLLKEERIAEMMREHWGPKFRKIH